MPRTTNTYMLAAWHSPEEILRSVERGLYAVAFGQVDITSGKFVFSCTEAYRIESGKIGAPVKGVTLIGNGPDVLTRVRMMGDDLQLDPGIGTWAKTARASPSASASPRCSSTTSPSAAPRFSVPLVNDLFTSRCYAHRERSGGNCIVRASSSEKTVNRFLVIFVTTIVLLGRAFQIQAAEFSCPA